MYDGVGVSLGNPWYLTTISVSHVVSRALQHFLKESAPIHVTGVSMPFWAQFDSSVSEGEIISAGSAKWKNLLGALAQWADGFWRVVKKYEGVNGQLDEQINRYGFNILCRLNLKGLIVLTRCNRDTGAPQYVL